MKVLLFIVFLLSGCKKEFSCEDCTGPAPPAPKEYIIYYRLYVPDNYDLSTVEPQIKTRLLGRFVSFTGFAATADSSYLYQGQFNLADYISLSGLRPGDTLAIRYARYWYSRPPDYVAPDTLFF